MKNNAKMQKRWADANRERYREISKEFYTHHIESERLKRKAWYQKNKEKVKAYAKAYYRRRGRAAKYKLTMLEFRELRRVQKNKCAGCTASFGRKERPHIDHDHKTKLTRGLLCRACNLALGYLKDDPKRAMALAKYLVRHRHAPSAWL